MTASSEVVCFLGAWRWLVEENIVTAGEKLALAYSISPDQARGGIALELFASTIHPEDRGFFDQEITKASFFGGDINLDYRLVNRSGTVRRVFASGTCIRVERGRPAEFLGAVHAVDEASLDPLGLAADHLLAAAKIVRSANETSVSLFVDMALTEAGNRMASGLAGKCSSMRPYRSAS